MRRDLSMVRKLEKIEKEMGYCEIKLEKEQRLRTQLHFLKLHRLALDRAVASFHEQAESTLNAAGNRLAGVRLAEIPQRVVLEGDVETLNRLREAFTAVGTLSLIGEQQTLIHREIEGLESKLTTFHAFSVKKDGLVSEREKALDNFGKEGCEEMIALSRQFEGIERSWNILTEDLMNLDEAVFAVTRCVDYLNSSRDFVLASRSQFALDRWLREGYLIDLFKHSTVGRAKEMVEGADRNLKMALVELVCLEDILIQPEDFDQLLLPFLEALFDDLFVGGKLRKTCEFLDERTHRAEQLRDKLTERRETVLADQLEQERSRVRVFHEMGDRRKKLSVIGSE